MNNILYVIFFYPIALIFLIKLSIKLNFVDNPNSRKVHQNPVPNTAGVGFYLLLFILIAKTEFSFEIENIVAAGIIIMLAGFFDDRLDLNPGMKMILIILPIVYLIFDGHVVKDLGNYNYIGLLQLGKFSIIFTLLAAGLLINSFNYIDGIDGLLISLSIIFLTYLSFLLNDSFLNESFFFIVITALLINLIFNFQNYKSGLKIFLGDAGSLFLGFLMSFLIIYSYNIKDIHPAYLIWGVWYPVYDFLYVTFYRIIKKINFTKPDKIHLHHMIIKKFKGNHFKSCILIIFINIIVITFGYSATKYISELISLILFLIFFFIFIFLRRSMMHKVKKY